MMEEEGVTDTNLAFRVDPTKLNQERGRATKRIKDRNEAEKDRRDRTNAILGKLAADYLPRVLTGNRKLDKCSILCHVKNYIRIKKLTQGCTKNELSSIRGWYKYVEDMDDHLVEQHFMIIREEEVILQYATQALTDQLGHSLVDVIGHSVLEIVHPEDQHELACQFFSISGKERKTFRLRILDNTSKHSSVYQAVQIEGTIMQYKMTVNKLERVLLCLWKLCSRSPPSLCRELTPPLHPHYSNKWLSCHDLEGRLTFSSHECASLTGFLPHETLGLSAYSMLHTEDLGAVAAMHNLYLQEGFSRWTVFRMKTKDQRLIPVATLTHLVTKWNKQPDYIVSLNKMLEEDEWEKLRKQQDQFIRSRALVVNGGHVESAAETSSSGGSTNPSVDSPHSSSYYSNSSELSPSSSSKSGSIVTISAKRKIHVIDTNPVKKLCAAEAGLPVTSFNGDDYKNVGESDIVEAVCPKPKFLGDEPEDPISVIVWTNMDSSQSTTSCPSRENSQCLSPEAGDLSLPNIMADFPNDLPTSTAHNTDEPHIPNSSTFDNDSNPSFNMGSMSHNNQRHRNNSSNSSVGSCASSASQVPGPVKSKSSLLQNINRSMASSNRKPQHILAELQKPSLQPLISSTASQKIHNELFDGIDPSKLQSILSMFLKADNTICDLDSPDFSRQLQTSSQTDQVGPAIRDSNPGPGDLAALCNHSTNGLLDHAFNPSTQAEVRGQTQLINPQLSEKPHYLYDMLPDTLTLDSVEVEPTNQGSAFEYCSDQQQNAQQLMYRGTKGYPDQEKLDL